MKASNPAFISRHVLAASIAATLLSIVPARASLLNWDVSPGTIGTGDNSITGGTGIWNLTTGNWTPDSGTTNVPWVNRATPDSAIFGGTAGTVMLGTGITANALTFDTAGYLLTGKALTLAGTTPTITTNANATIDSVLAGTSGLVKAGAGSLTLQGANTYSGGTILNAGTLILNHPTAIGTGTFTIAGGTINTTVGGISLTNNNPQNWAGNFTFTGTQNLNLGTGAVAMDATRTVTVTASTLTVGGVISGNGFGLVKAGGGTLVLSGANQYTGATSVNAGFLSVSSIGNTGAVSNLGTGSTINLGAGTTLGTLTYTGAGETTDRVLNWSGAGGGGQVITNGASLLRFTSNTTSTGSGAKGLFFGGTGNGQIDGTITNSGGLMNLSKNGTGIWTLAGNLTLGAGNITVNGGTLVLGGTNVATGVYTVNAGGHLALAGTNTNTAAISVKDGGMIGGAGSTTGVLTMANNSIVLLNTGAPATSIKTNGVTFSGTSTIGFESTPSSGNYTVLNYGGAAAPSLTSLVGARGGFTLDTSDPNNQKIIANVSVANRTWKGLSGTWDVGGSTAWAEGDQMFFAGDTVTFNEPAEFSTVDLTGPLAPSSVTVNNSTNPYTFSGVGSITGPTSLTKTGVGTLTVAQANSYAGGTVVRSGTLIGQNNTAFGSGAITLGDASSGAADIALRFVDSVDPNNPITVSASGSGTVTIGTSGLGVAVNATTLAGLLTLNRATTIDSTVTDRLAINGQITGNVGTLTISGGGRTTFASTANDFLGDVVISGSGTILQVSVASAAEVVPNTSSVTVEAGAVLQLASSAGAETINALHGEGSVRTFPTGAYGSTLVVGSAGGSGTFSGDLNNGFSALSLTKVGEGTQILTGFNNGYTGATTVSGGTLLVSGSISGTTKVNLTAGTLRLAASDVINDAAEVNLAGGKLETGGFSEGSSTFGGLGLLTVSGNSIVDFGAGNASQLLFSGVGVHITGATLSIENWSGTPLQAGTTGDRFMFFGDDTARLAFESAFPQSDISFNGIGGYATVQYDASHFEIVAIPEPSSAALIGGMALLRLMRFRNRRRFSPARALQVHE